MLLANWPKPIRSALFAVLGVNWVIKFLTKTQQEQPTTHQLIQAAFDRNNFDVQVFDEYKVPRSGGCIIASNHPHGFFDGLGGVWLGSKNGQDCRAIGRHFLSVFEPIKNLFLFIKIDAARRSNQGSEITRQASEFVTQGGRLAINSAGRLSYAKPFWAPAKDLPWKTGTIRIAQAANAPIVLVYMDMNQSALRQLCQRIHPVVRALAQVWAFRFKHRQKLHMHVLTVIQPEDIPEGSAQNKTQWLQNRFNELAAQIN